MYARDLGANNVSADGCATGGNGGRGEERMEEFAVILGWSGNQRESERECVWEGQRWKVRYGIIEGVALEEGKAEAVGHLLHQ